MIGEITSCALLERVYMLLIPWQMMSISTIVEFEVHWNLIRMFSQELIETGFGGFEGPNKLTQRIPQRQWILTDVHQITQFTTRRQRDFISVQQCCSQKNLHNVCEFLNITQRHSRINCMQTFFDGMKIENWNFWLLSDIEKCFSLSVCLTRLTNIWAACCCCAIIRSIQTASYQCTTE